MSMASKDDNAVLIVGAGPVGLLMANGLAANGISFTIIDKKSGPSTESKGLAISIGSHYGFALCGIKNPIGTQGCKIDRLDIFWHRRRFSSINFSHLNTEINYLTTQPQWVTEKELISELGDKNHSVKWHNELISLNQSSTCVSVKLKRKGKIITENYSYVIGCDGKHSKVSSYIKANSKYTRYDMYFVLGDYELAGMTSRNVVQYQVFDEEFYILIPISDKITRIVVKHNGTPPKRKVTHKDICNVVNKLAGFELINSEPHWISRAPFYNSVSEKMRRGRLFIAGDAAHLYSPIGGTGMNTGFLDAINLLWKLIYVVKGYCSSEILESYEKERVEANIAGAKVVDENTRNISNIDHASDFIEMSKPIMSNRHNLKRYLPKSYSGYSYSYMGTGAIETRWKRYDAKLCEAIINQMKLIDSNIVTFKYTIIIGTNKFKGNETTLISNLIEVFLDCKFIELLIIGDENGKLNITKYQNKNVHFLKYDTYGLNKVLEDGISLIRPDGVIQYTSDISNAKLAYDHIISNFNFTKLNLSILEKLNFNTSANVND